jgi:hypothetical protein
MININVMEDIGVNVVNYSSAQLLLDKISRKENEKYILSSNDIIIDFDGVGVISSPFFNGSLGYLLKDISIEELMSTVKIKNIPDYARDILNSVIQNSIDYYKD